MSRHPEDDAAIRSRRTLDLGMTSTRRAERTFTRRALWCAAAVAWLSGSGAHALTITGYDPATSITALTNALLAQNSGIVITSTTFIGATGQSGAYSDFNLASSTAGKAAVSAPDGVLLTNGTANIPLSNMATNFSITTGTGSNALLSALSASANGTTVTNDQNVLAITFTVSNPTQNAVSANLVYGSDEYPETSVTDIFGFFLDGKNYAFFPDGSLVSFKGSNAANFNNNTDGSYGLEYDGISSFLTINALLDPSLTTHTLVIAIADTFDSIFDSGAFVSSLTSTLLTGGGGITTNDVINTTGGDIAPSIFSLDSAAAKAATVRFDGGTLRETGGTFAGNIITAPVTLSANNGTVDTSLGNGGFSGVVSGPGSLTVQGGGTFSLSAANTYAGGTVLVGSTILFGNAAALGTGALTMDAGLLQVATGTDVALANAITITAGGGTLDSNGVRLTLNGAIGDGPSGTGTLVLADSGTGGANHIDFVVNMTNTFSGAVTVRSNTYVVDGADNGVGVGSLEVGQGGIFDLGSHNQSVTQLSGQGVVQASGFGASGALGTLTVQSGTFGGTLQDGQVTNTDASGTVTSVSGQLGLTKVSDGTTGGGTLLLAGTSTYSGPTAINGGTLRAGSSSGLSAASAVTVAAGAILDIGGFNVAIPTLAGTGSAVNGGTTAATLTIGETGASATFDGTLADGTAALSLAKAGGGTLDLTGSNTYSGGTFLDAGIIAVGNASALGTGTVHMANGTTLAFLGSDTLANAIDFAGAGDPTIDTGPNDVTLSGVISGPGDLTKTGTGTLDLTAVNTYTGPTTVAQGTLLVDGSIANSVVTVEAGANFGGTGRIGGLVVNGGATVAPGTVAPFSTLTVGGNLTMQAGSTYRVNVDAAGQSDIIAVTGTATIAGGTVDVQAAPGNYTAGTSYTILTATGGIGGQFGTLQTTSNLAFLTPTLTYGAAAVTLDLNQTVMLPSVAATPNQKAVAAAIQSLGPGNPLFDAVVGQDAAGARQAFQATAGEAHASATTQALTSQRRVSGVIFDRLWNIAGTEGSDAVSVLDQFGPTTLPTLVRCYTPVTEPGKETPSTYAVWGQAIGAFGRTLGDGNAATVSSTLGGFAVGADTRIDAKGLENWRVGVAAGYTNNSFSVKGGGGTGTFENVFGTLYAGARYGALDVRLGASYGGTATNLRRTVAFPGFNELERSSNDGSTVQAFGEIGYRLAFGQAVVEPVLGGAITHVHQDGFREKGGTAALVGFDEDTDVGSTTLGVRSEAAPFADVPLVARLFLGWQHAYGNTNPASTLAFASGSTRFETYGTPIDKNSVVAETGLDWRATAALTLGLAYTGQAGDHGRDNAVKGRAEYRF